MNKMVKIILLQHAFFILGTFATNSTDFDVVSKDAKHDFVLSDFNK